MWTAWISQMRVYPCPVVSPSTLRVPHSVVGGVEKCRHQSCCIGASSSGIVCRRKHSQKIFFILFFSQRALASWCVELSAPCTRRLIMCSDVMSLFTRCCRCVLCTRKSTARLGYFPGWGSEVVHPQPRRRGRVFCQEVCSYLLYEKCVV